jgi:hypothetical protein
MDNYISPDLLYDLATKQIFCCGTIRHNWKGMPRDLGSKRMALQQADLQVWTRLHLRAILWRHKCDTRISTNMRDAPAESNFCDNNRKVQILVDYNCHICYVDKADRKENSYSINRRTWKGTKKLFFHLFDLDYSKQLHSYFLM